MPPIRASVTRRQALRLLLSTAVGTIGASLIASCGPAPAAPAKPAEPKAAEAKPAESKPAPAATTAPAAAKPQPAMTGGKAIIAQDTDWVSLDPNKTSGFNSAIAYEHIYESLTTFDADMKIQPMLAERWETVDPTTWVFHLRKGVKWHNGREFAASDVVYWYERMMDPKTAAPQKGVFTVIKQIEPVDSSTVRILLHKPHATLPAAFASLRGSAMPNKETVEQHGGELAAHGIGTGAFKLAEVVSTDYVRYVRNPDYWDKSVPTLEELTIKLMVDEDQRIAALRSGQIHLAPLSAVGAQRLASDPNITILRSPKASLFMVMIESMRKPFDDARVRKAMSLAIDRNAIIQKAAQGAGVLSGPTPTGHSDWYVPEDKLPYKQDVEGAKRLLAEAGYANGFKTSIRTLGTNPEWVGCAVELKNQLQAVGIDVTVEQLEQGQMSRSANIGGDPTKPSEFEMQMATFSFYPDPDAYVGQLMPDRNVVTRGGNTALKDDAINELLDKAEATTDHEERKKLYLDAQMRFLNDLVPALYLYAGMQIDGVSSQLKNYKQSFLSRRLLMKYTSVG